MGIYSLVLLFIGILTIGLLYVRFGTDHWWGHILFAIVLILFLIIFFIVHHYFEKTCIILVAGNLDQTINLIRSWGIAAPLMSILLMVTQAIVAPLPAFIVTAANGIIFGRLWGAAISWIGALMGALVSFYIARLFVGVALRKVVHNRKAAEFIKSAGKKRGFYVILFSRLVPFISFDLISYMAGLSGIRPWAFILATALGMLPATIIYSSIGLQFRKMEENSPIYLTYTVVFIFILIVFSVVQTLREKK
jgi:uncharacterized membrane protein YdjX (TVP38/TMEM64 family)